MYKDISLFCIRMNVVLVTSMIRPINGPSIFTTTERISQTIKTIETVRKKIERCYIVLIEGSIIEEDEKKLLKESVDNIYAFDVTPCYKSIGEAILICNYLSSDSFKELKNVNTVTKISGRYHLNTGFDDIHKFSLYSPYSKFFQSFCILYVEQTHIHLGAFNTTFYKMHVSGLPFFIEGLNRYIHSEKPVYDIEHSFNVYNVVPKDYCKLHKIHVSGLISSNGTHVDM